jgi:hypothetical protein
MTEVDEEEQFLENLEAILPDGLTGAAVIVACEQLLVNYAGNGTEAALWLNTLIARLAKYYRAVADECTCDRCVAERKASMN